MTSEKQTSGSSEPAVHQLDGPGGQLCYEVRGSGPLLLIIGQPMTAVPFAPLADLLATDHTVLTYDPHGLGRSLADDPSLLVTPEVQADDLARIVDAVGGGPADVFGSSGGAVTGLAYAVRHPERVRTLVAHEPPVTDLLPDAVHVRAAVDGVEEAYRSAGSGAGWAAFVSLVVHQGPVTADGVPPVSWPPAGQQPPGAAEPETTTDAPPTPSPPEPTEKQQADDALFFLRMLKPFTRYQPEIAALRSGPPRLVVAVGATSEAEVAVRSARVLAERLGVSPVSFPGDHAGFLGDPVGFASRLREVLASTA